MAEKKINDVFDDEVEDVFEKEKFVKKCKTCGAEIETDAQYCPMCGSKIGESVDNAVEEIEAPKGPIKPRPLKKGEKVEKSATPTQEYKYGDGYSVSSLSLCALYGCWAFPVISFIMSLIGLSTKNPKDKKLFKIALVLDVIFFVIHVILIVYGILNFRAE